MKLVVCVKHVPEIAEIKIDPDTKTIVRENVPSILNPFDEYAVEEALRIRDRHCGEIVVVTMGPPQAREALFKCLAMGVDKAIHLTDKAFAGADTLATAHTLAQAIIEFAPEFDIIICGKQAIDGDTAQVPPELAEQLGIPIITGVQKEDVDPDKRKIVAHRETEEGYEVVECKLPILFTAIKGLNEPRIPTVLGIMTAKRKEIKVVTITDLRSDTSRFGLAGSPTQVIEVFTPKPREGGIIIREENPVEAARDIVRFLMKENIIKTRG